jgi:hypothetical protein
MSKDGKQKRRGGKSRESTERRRGTLRRDALLTPLPRHRQPTINDKKMASCLAAAAEFADALENDGAELRKSRFKLDEIVHLLNSGTDPARIMNIIESAVQECRVTFAEGRKTLGDFKEVFAMDDEASGPERCKPLKDASPAFSFRPQGRTPGREGSPARRRRQPSPPARGISKRSR